MKSTGKHYSLTVAARKGGVDRNVEARMTESPRKGRGDRGACYFENFPNANPGAPFGAPGFLFTDKHKSIRLCSQ